MLPPASGGAVRVRLFDADRTDEELELDDALGRRVKDTQLLWVDAHGDLDSAVVEKLDKRLQLGPSTGAALRKLGTGPHLAIHGRHLHLRVMGSPGEGSDGEDWIDMVAARNVVITAHREPAPFLERVDERIQDDAATGRLDAPEFVRSILDALVTTYFEAVDGIEDEVDALDNRSLLAQPDEDILPDLVALRRRIAALRRSLSDHREVFAALAGIDFSKITDASEETAIGFATVASRFEGSIKSVEDSRDLLLGSFDVFMSRLAQRTNDAMKVLALATTLLLPGSLIAGLLGMNVVVPLPKDDPISFWIVMVGIAVLATVVLVVAWRSHWIRIGRPRRLPPSNDGPGVAQRT